MAKLSQFAQKSLRDSFKDASGMLTGFGQGIPPVQPSQQFNTGGGLGKSVRNIAGILTGKNFNTPREELQLDLKTALEEADKATGIDKIRKLINIQTQFSNILGPSQTASLKNSINSMISLEQLQGEKTDKSKELNKASVTPTYARDSENNTFTIFNEFEDGEPKQNIIPTPGQEAKTPKGKLTPTNEFFQTSDEVSQNEIQKQKEIAQATSNIDIEGKQKEAFNEMRRQAMNEGIAAKEEIPKLRRALDAARKVGGGTLPGIIDEFKNAIGLADAEYADFNTAYGEMMLSKLNKLSGSISDGERTEIKNFIANIRNSKEVNIRYIEIALETLEQAQQNALVLAADLKKDPDQRQFKDYYSWQIYLLENGLVNLEEKKQMKTYGPSNTVDQ